MELLFKLKQLDFMAPPVMLNMRGHTGMKTYFGLAMTICYIAVSVSLSIVISLTFFDYSDPSVSQQTTESGVYPKISMAENRMFPVLYVFHDDIINTLPKDVPQYITPMFSKLKYYLKTDEKGNIKSSFEYVQMPLVQCSELKKNETANKFYQEYENTEFYKSYAMDFGFCVHANEAESFVKGGGTDSLVDMMTLLIYPCTLPTGCKPMEEIAQVGVILSNPVYSLNFSDYKKPVTPYLTSDNSYYLNPATKNKYLARRSINEIYDDRGMFFDKTQRTNYSEQTRLISSQGYRPPGQVNCTLAEIYGFKCQAYLTFEYMSSGRKVRVDRVYKTITKTLSEIGGINSIAFVFFFYINLVYSRWTMKVTLVNEVFKFLDEKKSKNTKTGSDKEPQHGCESEGLKSLGWHTTDKRKREQLRAKAFSQIQNSLDIVSIVKELNNLKVLTHLLMKDYHLKLAPVLALKLQMANKKNKSSKKRSNLDHSGIEESPNKLSNYAEDEKINYLTALRIVTEQYQANRIHGGGYGSLENKIDLFYYEAFNKPEVYLLQLNDNNDLESARHFIKEKPGDQPGIEDWHEQELVAKPFKNRERLGSSKSRVCPIIRPVNSVYPDSRSRIMIVKGGHANQIKVPIRNVVG